MKKYEVTHKLVFSHFQGQSTYFQIKYKSTCIMHMNLNGTCNEPLLLGSDAEIICKAATVGT
jgi:hypothetical protein